MPEGIRKRKRTGCSTWGEAVGAKVVGFGVLGLWVGARVSGEAVGKVG